MSIVSRQMAHYHTHGVFRQQPGVHIYDGPKGVGCRIITTGQTIGPLPGPTPAQRQAINTTNPRRRTSPRRPCSNCRIITDPDSPPVTAPAPLLASPQSPKPQAPASTSEPSASS